MNFDKEIEIIVYCASESFGASEKAVEKLEKLGFENVKDFKAGLRLERSREADSRRIENWIK